MEVELVSVKAGEWARRFECGRTETLDRSALWMSLTHDAASEACCGRSRTTIWESLSVNVPARKREAVVVSSSAVPSYVTTPLARHTLSR